MPDLHILTGEYPGQPGGVSDYTRSVAKALAEAGQAVHVWAPPHDGPTTNDPGVNVHRLPDRFGVRTLRRLGAKLNAWPHPSRLLIQYVPHAFGWKAMNVGLASWLRWRRQPVWVMFHEVSFPGERWRPLKHRILSRATRAIAREIASGAQRIFVSIPAWAHLLRNYTGRPLAAEWLPIPSAIPTEVDPAAPRRFRESHAIPPAAPLVGHFGTYGDLISAMLEPALRELLKMNPAARAILLGRNGAKSAERLHEFGKRVIATDALPAAELSVAIAACDLMLQPFPDGISCRRSSAMACLALARPTITTLGVNSEPFWRDSGAASCVDELEQLTPRAVALLGDASALTRLGAEAKSLYDRRFSLRKTVNVLLGAEAAEAV